MSDAKTVHLVCDMPTGGPTVVSLPGNPIATKRVTFLECILPNTIYKVNSTNNNLDFTYSAVQYTATIPPGGYSVGDLMTAIATAMTAQVNNTWTATYNSDTMLVTIGGAANFVLNFGTGPNVATSIGPLLGFTVADTASATSATGTSVIQLYTPLALYINVDKLGSHVFVNPSNAPGKGTGFTFRIPTTVESGAIIQADRFQQYDQIIACAQSVSLSQFTVTLCWPSGAPVQLNGAAWQLVLEVE